MQDRDSASPPGNPMSTKGALQHTREILTSTTKTTKAMLSTVTDKKWWKKTLKSLHRKGHSSNTYEVDDDNEDFERQGSHPFYESILPDAMMNTAEGDYSNIRLPRLHAATLDLSEAVLRTGKLEETMTTGESGHPPDELLLQLAQDSLSKDTLLGLAYLLALPKALDAEQCFSKNPHTAISLQIAAYYYALQIYTHCIPESQPQQHPLYSSDPSKVISTVVEYVTSMPESDWPESVKDLVPKLKHYEELLMDYTQAQMLQGLGRGVDVGRFTKDDEYKFETIIGLAMSQADNVYEIAVTLAQRYKIPLWEIYMTHLEYLFDCGLTTEEIDKRVRDLALLGKLHEKPQDFCTRMFKFVYPTIEGTDHGGLVYFYTLLGNIPAEGDTMTADEHIKLLKKIKSAASGLDYKKLMSGKHRPLDVVQPILNTGNVHVIAKLASKIPDPRGGFLQPSLVFCAWATKVFWHGEAGAKKEAKNMTDWLHRYEQCGEYIQKMSPCDFLDFIDGIVFVPAALKELGSECRHEICRRALKLTRQQAGKKKKHNNSGSEVVWGDAVEKIQKWINHQDTCNNGTILSLRQSDDEDLMKYADKFDLSKGEEQKLESLLMEVLVDGQLPDIVQKIVDASPVGCWTPQTALVNSIQLCVQAVREPSNKSEILGEREALEVLRTLVQVTSEHNKHGGDLVGLEDVMSQVRPFCADASLPIQARLDALQIVEQSFELNDEDLSLLTLYRTNAIVSEHWQNSKIEQEQVKTDAERMTIYQDLLTKSDSLQQYLSLAKLLHVWPQKQENLEDGDAETHPWYQLFNGMVTSCGQEASSHVVEIVKDIQRSQPLSEKVMKALYELLKNHELNMCGVKCLLISEYIDLHEIAVQELCLQTEVLEDEDLWLLILQRHLVVNLVNSVYYTDLIAFIINKEQDTNEEPLYFLSSQEVANQLMEAGYPAHAGSLLVQTRGMDVSAWSFNTALDILSSWLGKKS